MRRVHYQDRGGPRSDPSIAAVTTTTEQQLWALTRANEVRLGRAGIKREMRAGDRSFAELLADIPL